MPRNQILFLFTETHRPFYLREPAINPCQRIVQPANKGTLPPILYSLLSIQSQAPDAVVAILPCDHYFTDEPSFTTLLDSAFDIAARHPASVVLLGAPARGPEIEYGWIDVGAPLGSAADSFRIRAFYEKPSLPVACEMFHRGSLWNTFVMVGQVRGFLDMIAEAQSAVVEALRTTRLWAASEIHIPTSLFDRLLALDFSRQVLSPQIRRLIAMRMGLVGWSDLGHPERVLAVLAESRLQPEWLQDWLLKRPPGVVPARTKAAVA